MLIVLKLCDNQKLVVCASDDLCVSYYRRWSHICIIFSALLCLISQLKPLN